MLFFSLSLQTIKCRKKLRLSTLQIGRMSQRETSPRMNNSLMSRGEKYTLPRLSFEKSKVLHHRPHIHFSSSLEIQQTRGYFPSRTCFWRKYASKPLFLSCKFTILEIAFVNHKNSSCVSWIY